MTGRAPRQEMGEKVRALMSEHSCIRKVPGFNFAAQRKVCFLMAKVADALASGARGREVVRVQVQLGAHKEATLRFKVLFRFAYAEMHPVRQLPVAEGVTGRMIPDVQTTRGRLHGRPLVVSRRPRLSCTGHFISIIFLTPTVPPASNREKYMPEAWPTAFHRAACWPAGWSSSTS